MASRLTEIFTDEKLVERIKRRLPYLFQLAQLESSRAGTAGMQVGSARENIIIALLIYKFGEANVDTSIPTTGSEVDTRLFEQPISIKTITGKSLSGVKLSWTVDAQKSKGFRETYYPSCDILFVQINWNGCGGFYYIPMEVQRKIFDRMGKQEYIKLPKPGTNPRGIEITRQALLALVKDSETKGIEIDWLETKIDINPYKRWVDLWGED